MTLTAFALTGLIIMTSRAAGGDIEAIRDSLADNPSSSLTVHSAPDSALVRINGTLKGYTPLDIDSLSPGRYVLQILPKEIDSWLSNPISDTLLLAAGEHRVLSYKLEERNIVTSSPFGGEVALSDSILGTTPLALPNELMQRPLMVRKQGYETATIFPGSLRTIRLKPLWKNGEGPESVFRDADVRSRKTTELYLTGAATVLSGVTAAFLKIRADNRYQQYLASGDPSLLSQTHRLDTAAGIAIVATQISLGLFTYFILSQ